MKTSIGYMASTVGLKAIAGLVAIVALIAPPASADWIRAGIGPYEYTNAENWSDGAPNGVFPSGLNVTTQIVTFAQDTVLSGGIAMSWTNTAPGLYGRWRLTSDGAAARTLTLGGDVTVFCVANNTIVFGSRTANSGLSIALGGNRLFHVTGSTWNDNGNYAFVIESPIVGDGYGFTKTGPGLLELQSASTFTGPLIVKDGTIRLSTDAARLATTNITLAYPGMLFQNYRVWAEDGGGISSRGDKLSDQGIITLRGGTYYFYGTDFATVSETVGVVRLESGYSPVRVETVGTNYYNATLTAGKLTRLAGSTMGIMGKTLNVVNMGTGTGVDESRVLLEDSSGVDIVNGIIPWAVHGQELVTGSTNFMTYGAYGFTPAPHTSTNLFTAGPTDNVYFHNTANPVMNGETLTVNSLVLSGKNISGPGTIKVTSGALMGISVGYIASPSPNYDFNGREAIIFYYNNSWYNWGSLTNIGPDGITFCGPRDITGGGYMIYEYGYIYNPGPIRINAGHVIFSSGRIPTNCVMRVDAGGVLNLYRGNQALAGLEGDGILQYTYLTSGNEVNTLTVGLNNNDYEFSGRIQTCLTGGTSTGGNIVKVGSGAWILSGTNNTYSGNTIVSNGSLFVNGAIVGAGSNIVVAGNASTHGTLGGIGRVDRAVIVQSNAVVDAGAMANGIGNLTVAGNLELQAGAVVHCDGNASTGDTVAVTGTLTLPAQATVNLAIPAGVTPPKRIVLFSANQLSGTTDLSDWAVAFPGSEVSYDVLVEGSAVVLIKRSGGTLMIVR
ncbi:MAG: autotransporter-associated beta strand repeat-containing protein [Kiritimatiellae bacterium]|nr:autotransporter-associated beta strand repeat-containing protein [Kiritimatiellia bacterium]